MKNLLLVSTGLAIFYLSRTVSAVDSLSYQLVGFKVESIQPTYLDTTITFQVENPSSQDLVFSQFESALYYESQMISVLSASGKSVIKARSSKWVHIRTPLQIESSLTALVSLINSRQLKPFLFRGSIKLNGIKYPFTEQIKLSHGK